MVGDPFADSGNPNTKTLKVAPVSTDAVGGDKTLIVAIPGQRLKVYALVLSASVATTLTWKSGATALSGAYSIGANALIALVIEPPAYLFGTNPGDPLILNVSGLAAIAGWLSYWDDDMV